MPYVHTLTTASATLDLTTTASSQVLDFIPNGEDAPNGDNRLGDQIATVDIVSAATGAAATVVFVLADPNATNTKIRTVEVTVTPTAYRAVAAGGATGGYVCTVAFPDGTNKIDLNGGPGTPIRSVTASNSVGSALSQKTQWYLCYKADPGSLGNLTVYVSPTRAI